MKISIVYEDSDFLAINKPAGLLTHPRNENDHSESVSDWILEKYPKIKEIGEDPIRPGIIHRLDKSTSGILVIAKNKKTFHYFKELFKDRKIQKTYIALVYGDVKNNTGIIDAPLGKIGTHQTTKISGKKIIKEREALTEYKVIKKFEDYTLLEAYPRTGRTHQIRVHFNSINHPVVGDNVYGNRKRETKLNRMFLHALKLEFISPNGEAISLETELPVELSSFLKGLEK